MDRATVKAVIEQECKKRYGSMLELSPYTLQLLHESGDYNIIDGHPLYYCKLTDYSPLLDFAVLGHCIANSSYKWDTGARRQPGSVHAIYRENRHAYPDTEQPQQS